MESCLHFCDFSLLSGREENNVIFPQNGEIILGAPLPDGWNQMDKAVVRLRADAEHQVEIRVGLCASSKDDPQITMHYKVLPQCKIQVPFPIDNQTLAVDYAFLPPWPGVFKGGVKGVPTVPEKVNFIRLTLREPTLRCVELESVTFVSSWQPQDVEGRPLLDEFGQCKSRHWNGKTKSMEDLRAKLMEELEWAKTHNHYPDEWSSYGGWKKKRFEATGWFHTANDGRRWWLVDPEGYAFFSNGMCYGNRTGIYGMADHLANLHEWLPEREGLFEHAWTTGDQIPQYVVRNGVKNARTRDLVNFPRANMMRVFGEDWLDAWITINMSRMRTWGINTLGVGVNDYGDEKTVEFLQKAKIPYVITFKFFPLTTQRIFRDFPDVFSDEYAKLAKEMAERELTGSRNDPLLIGYFLTNEPEWLMHKGVNLAECLLAAKGCYASKRAFIDFLQDQYVSVDAINAAWKTSLTCFNELLDPFRCEQWTEAAQFDLNEYHKVLVETYGRVISDATRAVDPHHLNLGMRYSSASEKTLCGTLSHFDVFSFNCYGTEPASAAARITTGVDLPVIVGEWHVGAKDSGLDAWGLYYTDTQDERARAISHYLEQSTQEPHLTGVHYFEYGDQPYLGRFDGECYNIGVIDVCNRPYPLVAEALRIFALRMYPLLERQVEPTACGVKLKNIWNNVN